MHLYATFVTVQALKWQPYQISYQYYMHSYCRS